MEENKDLFEEDKSSTSGKEESTNNINNINDINNIYNKNPKRSISINEREITTDMESISPSEFKDDPSKDRKESNINHSMSHEESPDIYQEVNYLPLQMQPADLLKKSSQLKEEVKSPLFSKYF